MTDERKLLRGPDERGMYYLTSAGHDLLMGALKRSTKHLYTIRRASKGGGTAMSEVEELVGRLGKRAKKEREIAENNRIVAELLQPQIDRFNERDGEPWNTYAVRLAVDHRESAKKDAAFADDLDEAAATITRLSEENARLRRVVEEYRTDLLARGYGVGDDEVTRLTNVLATQGESSRGKL